jgi:hypothetical protein
VIVVIIVVLLSDYIVVGSDSGRIVILEYISTKNIFEKVHQETFGKSGCRRIVPGQYLAIDPKGRAVMIGNINRLVFLLVVLYFIMYVTYTSVLQLVCHHKVSGLPQVFIRKCIFTCYS